MQKKLMLVVGLFVIAVMVLTSCTPQTVVETVTVKETQIVNVETTKIVNVETTKIVESTKIVEVAKASFTTPHPILSKLEVRQAMAYCTNKLDLLKAAYPLSTEADRAALVMNTFIPTKHWAYAGDENITLYPFDVAKGTALLETAGYKLAEGAAIRTDKDGNALSLKFTTTNAAFRIAWAAVWESQMKACGIEIIRLHAPASWWFGDSTGVKRRDFELGAFAWVGQADPGGQTLYACDQIPTVENNWAGQNGMGWCNQAASDAIKKANNTLVRADRVAQYTIVQKEFTKDVPTIPLFQRMDVYAVNSKLTGFAPKTNGDGFYTYNMETWVLPGKDTIVFGSIQEPSTLFQLIVDAMTARIVGSALSGVSFISENFDYFENQQKPLSTIENGLAKNNDVDVKEGDLILNANGDPVALKAGEKVMDITGATVDFKAGVKMKQLVVTYKWIAGMKYSGGNPVVKADFELNYKINCDKESGATSFITCFSIAKVDFVDDTSYTVTWKPGYQGATYYMAPIGFYDSNLKLSDGRLLKDVAAKDWGTLKEVAELELQDNVGPYMIKEWVKGQKITMVPNPNFYGGAPKTKNIVFLFVTAENADAQLLGGQVDILDALTITSISQTLKDAAGKGTITLITSPQATWEHIDINLFLR
jgi:ABC-type transport system substrate-binding protein